MQSRRAVDKIQIFGLMLQLFALSLLGIFIYWKVGSIEEGFLVGQGSNIFVETVNMALIFILTSVLLYRESITRICTDLSL
jgi:uncharacterized Tic20 family protein